MIILLQVRKSSLEELTSLSLARKMFLNLSTTDIQSQIILSFDGAQGNVLCIS